MPEREESPYVLKRKEELAEYVKERTSLRALLQHTKEQGRSTYDLKQKLTSVGWQIDRARKDIRASRMADKRAMGYRSVEKAAIKRRKRQDALQVREYLATEAEKYTVSEAFLFHFRAVYRDKNPREPLCFTCGDPLKAGDEVYRLSIQQNFVLIHVEHERTYAKKGLIERDRFRRENKLVFPLTLEDELYMQDFVSSCEAFEEEKRKNAPPELPPVSRVNNLQRIRDGKSRVVGM